MLSLCFHSYIFSHKRKSEFRVIVGDHHQTEDDKGEQMFKVEELILHRQYSGINYICNQQFMKNMKYVIYTYVYMSNVGVPIIKALGAGY